MMKSRLGPARVGSAATPWRPCQKEAMDPFIISQTNPRLTQDLSARPPGLPDVPDPPSSPGYLFSSFLPQSPREGNQLLSPLSLLCLSPFLTLSPFSLSLNC